MIQKGNSVTIHGRRYISSQRNGAVSDVDWIWKSDFGHICADGVLRFEYFIITVGGTKAERLSGFCRVVISHDGRTLDGDYSKLPPFEDNSENTEWGTIVFRKLEKGAVLERPHYGYDKEGNERHPTSENKPPKLVPLKP